MRTMRKGVFLACVMASFATMAGVEFSGDFLGERAVKFVSGDAAEMLKGVDGKIVLRKDASLDYCHWGLKSDGTTLTVSGRDGQAVIYGIYTFLEKHMGCRWYAPDVTKGLAVDKFPVVDEPDASCAYEYFNTSALQGGGHGCDRLDDVWLLRNKHSCDTAFSVGCHQGSPCGVHTFPKYVEEIRKTHPELFGVKPSATPGRKCETLCLTDPLVRELVAEQMIKYIEKDRAGGKRDAYSTSVIYDLAQADGPSGPQCMCEDCKAMMEREGSYAGPNIDFCNAVARKVNEKYPEIKVRTLAYAYVADPPKHVVADRNVIVRFCRAWVFDSLVAGKPHAKDLENWAKHAKTLGIWSYWRTYRGLLYPHVKKRADIEAEMRFCHENNARHYYAEDEAATERSFAMLQFWLMFKMAENPYQPIAPLAKEFLAAYYGPAAVPIEKYLDYLEERQEESQAYLDREFFEKVNVWLDEAENSVKDNAIFLRHVRWERTIVDRTMYGKLAQLLKAGFRYDAARVAGRFEKNAADVLDHWEGWKGKKFKEIRESRLLDLKREATLYSHYPVPLPKMFEGADVEVREWNQIPVVLGKFEYVDDPKAAAGTSFKIVDKEFDFPYGFGMYHNQRREGDNISLYPEDIPQDGEFHPYRIGRAVIQQPLYVFFHKSWNPRTYLPTLGIIPEERDVWVSARFQGPTFVKGSTDPDGVFIDRMYLVKGALLDLYEKPKPEDALVFKAASGDVTARTGLWETASLGDPEKLDRELYVRGHFSYEGATVADLPFAGLRCMDAKGKCVFSIPIATFYPGAFGDRKFETVVTAQSIRSRLRGKSGKYAPPCSLRFSLVVPSASPATVRVSSVAVVPVSRKGK